MTARPWVADPTVAWIIALHVRLEHPVPEVRLRSGLASTGLGSSIAVDTAASEPALLAQVTAPGPAPLRAALSGNDLAIGAEHRHCDGLGLLALLGTAIATTPTSSARGVGTRTPSETARAPVVRRVLEAVLAPPAVVAPGPAVAGSGGEAGDTFVRFSVPGRVGTSELVRAAAAGTMAHNREHGARDTRVAVAVGASRTGGSAPRVADDSALLRLRDVERLSARALREAIRSAVPQPPPPGSAGGSRLVATVTTAAMGALSSRLGSTLLVSHLGEVDAPGVADLAFYPVTGGGSGVSVGAVGLHGSTVITLRGRRHRHPAVTLEELGRRVRDELTSAGS